MLKVAGARGCRGPYRWQRSLDVLDGDGIPIHEFFRTAAGMGPGTARFHQLVVDRELTHEGSPRRIDGAVAAVMARHRAAELAGSGEPSIYM